ncbi:hypothetical protein N9B17_05685, partial [Rhodopirellula sp.]|nr:hypothetical protein [Rhodopirellula sp.]
GLARRLSGFDWAGFRSPRSISSIRCVNDWWVGSQPANHPNTKRTAAGSTADQAGSDIGGVF